MQTYLQQSSFLKLIGVFILSNWFSTSLGEAVIRLNNGILSLFSAISFFTANGAASEKSQYTVAYLTQQFYLIGLPCLLIAIGLGYYLIKQRRFLQLNPAVV